MTHTSWSRKLENPEQPAAAGRRDLHYGRQRTASLRRSSPNRSPSLPPGSRSTVTLRVWTAAFWLRVRANGTNRPANSFHPRAVFSSTPSSTTTTSKCHRQKHLFNLQNLKYAAILFGTTENAATTALCTLTISPLRLHKREKWGHCTPLSTPLLLHHLLKSTLISDERAGLQVCESYMSVSNWRSNHFLSYHILFYYMIVLDIIQNIDSRIAWFFYHHGENMHHTFAHRHFVCQCPCWQLHLVFITC